MTILSTNDYVAAAKQLVRINKTTSVTAVAQMPTAVFAAAGAPGAGTLAGSNTANGVVPTDAVAGFPLINAFGGGALGYLGNLSFSSTVACRIALMDCLFKAGAYTFNANVALTAQPSYSSRVPNGTDFTNTEIWIEAVTAFTGNQSIAVTYTNQDGVTGRTTGTIATGVAPIVARKLQLPLQAGDSGVQKIESVVSTVSTVGTFNVLVYRRLFTQRIRVAGDSVNVDFLASGLKPIYADSALLLVVTPDSTATGLAECQAEIANK